MTLGLIRSRLTAVLMALAIFMVAAPMLPASTATDCCDQMGMPMADSMSMTMDMKSPAKSHQMPAKPGLPCNESLNCLGGAGCAAPTFDLISVAALPGIGIADANWTSQLAGPSIAYKPALPPPIALA